MTSGNLRAEALGDWLDKRYAELAAAEPSAGEHPRPPATPGLTEWESRWFLAGLSSGLFTLSLVPEKKNPRPTWLFEGPMTHVREHLFGYRAGGKRQLQREQVPEYAAASYLVLDQGWQVNQVQIESDNWDIDILVFRDADKGGKPVIAGEVKSGVRRKGRSNIEAVIDEVRDCTASPCLARDHKTLEALVARDPEFFWAVDCDGGTAFAWEGPSSQLRLTPVDDLPRP